MFQGFGQYRLFGGNLGMVGQMLKAAAPAAPEKGAPGFNPEEGRFGKGCNFRPGPAGMFFGNPGREAVSGGAEGDKDFFPADNGQTFPAADDFFDGSGKNIAYCHVK
jgi:hypothetical protein